MFAQIDFIIDDSVDNEKSEAVAVPQWARRAQLFVPSIEDTAITMEMIEGRNVTAALLLASNNTSWKVVRSQDESSTVLASGVENCWVDITEFVRSLPQGCFIRFVSAVDQLADKSLIIVFRG